MQANYDSEDTFANISGYELPRDESIKELLSAGQAVHNCDGEWEWYEIETIKNLVKELLEL